MNRSTKTAQFTWLCSICLSTIGLVIAGGCRDGDSGGATAKRQDVGQPRQPDVEAVDARKVAEVDAPAAPPPAQDADLSTLSKAAANTPTAGTQQSESTEAIGADIAASDPGATDADSGDAEGQAQAASKNDEIADDLAGDNESDDASSESADSEVTSEEQAASDQGESRPVERFALLTPDGPLVVDVMITIDGDVHSSALEELVDEAYEAADTDGDGKRTWDEVVNSPKFMYGQFGNLPITEDSQKQQILTMYDRNDDGLVDRSELPRFVTRNVGRARSFSLRSSNEFRSDNRSRSPFRRLIDADHNGAITQEEMANAPARLLSRDADDDQIITLADFKQDAQAAMPGRLSNRRRTSEPDTAFLINDKTKWAYAAFALRELYGFGDDVSARDWPLTPELFATLDANGNDRLDRQEVEQLATVKPHLRLWARFGVKDGEAEARQTSLQIDSIDPAIEAAVTAVRTHQRRVSIELSRVEIELFVNEDPALSNYKEVAQAQFNTLDTDSNGYLEVDEIPAQLPGLNVPFAGVDADADGKVYLDELARFLDLRQRAYRGQVRARAADQEDALFTALDTNGDGRLHAREIAASPEVLAKMDLNQDGKLRSHEIPGSMVVGFVRGNPQQDDALFVMPTGANELGLESLPRWFLGMDTNRDGEVGDREFLGTSDRFKAFDKNGDGFINPTELPHEMLERPKNVAEGEVEAESEAEAAAESEAEAAVESEAEAAVDAAVDAAAELRVETAVEAEPPDA